MDPGAVSVLRQAGYRLDGHVAHRIDGDEIERADLVVAMEDLHVRQLRRLVPQADHIALLRSFDPAAGPGAGVPDPWYGPEEDFRDTLRTLGAAMPGVLDRVRQLQTRRRSHPL